LVLAKASSLQIPDRTSYDMPIFRIAGWFREKGAAMISRNGEVVPRGVARCFWVAIRFPVDPLAKTALWIHLLGPLTCQRNRGFFSAVITITTTTVDSHRFKSDMFLMRRLENRKRKPKEAFRTWI
jgi:hypothetical protein